MTLKVFFTNHKKDKSVRNIQIYLHINMRGGHVYIVTNKHNTVLYVGVTSELKVRIYKHKTGIGSFFTSKYKLKKLVWFEFHSSIEEAIYREKKIKKWKREWKLELIRKINPDLKDLYDEV